MFQSTINELFEFHLLVLRELFNGLSFSEIEQKYHDQMTALNYLSIAKENNLLTFDEQNNLIGAYPVSPLKTCFKVSNDNIGEGYCMCAIDALGIAYTFGEKTVITAKDKTTNANISLTVDPNSDKVTTQKNYYVTYKDPDKVQNIARDQCPVINFYSDRESIKLGSDFVIFSFDEAVNHAKHIFSPEAIKKSLSTGFKAIAKEDLFNQ